jgi:alkylhydroperoxidase family enzyme
MSPSPPRIEPVPPPFSDEVAEELARWMPPGAPVDPLALFRVLARDLPLAEAMRPLGSFQLSRRSSLSIRQRELVILRTCARLGAEYEWGVHAVAYAGAAELDADLVAAIASGGPAAFEGEDRAIVEFVDAMVGLAGSAFGGTDGDVDPVVARMRPWLSDEQLLELTVLCGWYHVISFVCLVADLPTEPWAARFPTSAEEAAS